MTQQSERMTNNKDIQDLIRVAKDQGWTVAHTGGGHLKWVNPKGEQYTSSATPSNQRTIINIKRDLRVMGLLGKEAWRRKRKEDRQNQAMIDLKRTLKAAEDGDLLPHERHEPANEPEPDSPAQEKPMERELWPPPEDQRINCPDCPTFFWNTDHDGLIRHLQSEHGKVVCPDCYKIMLATSLPAHTRTCRRRVTNNPLSKQLAESVVINVPKAERIAAHDWMEKQNDGRYHCDQCDQSFETKAQVKGHRVGKHGQKMMTCEKCGKEMNAGSYAVHQRTGCIPKAKRREHCPKCGKIMMASSIPGHLAESCPGFTEALTHPPEPEPQKREPAPEAASAPPAPERRPMVDDEDLFAALEIIIGDSIPMKAIPAAMAWVETTKKLIALVNAS